MPRHQSLDMNRAGRADLGSEEAHGDVIYISSSEEDVPFDGIVQQKEQAPKRSHEDRREEVWEFSTDISRTIPVHFVPQALARQLVEAYQKRLALLQDYNVSIHNVKVGSGGFLYWDEMPLAQAVDGIHCNLQQALKVFGEAAMIGPLLRHELEAKSTLRINEAQRIGINIDSIRYEDFLPTWDDRRNPEQVAVPPRSNTPVQEERQASATMNTPQTPEQQSMPFASNAGRFFSVEDFSVPESSSEDSEDDDGSDMFDENSSVLARPAPDEANIIHDVEMVGCEGGPQIVDLEVYLAPCEDDSDGADSLFGGDIEMAVDREAFTAVHGTEGVIDIEIRDDDGALVQVKFADEHQVEEVAVGGKGPPQRAEPLPLFPRVTGKSISSAT